MKKDGIIILLEVVMALNIYNDYTRGNSYGKY